WQMNLNPTRSKMSFLLPSLGGIFALIAAVATEAPMDKPDPKPGETFQDCPDCPEMVVIPAGEFTMGSSDSEKDWAAHHGRPWDDKQHIISLRDFALAVADEAPQHKVSLRSFALGKYDVTRREYAAFVSETGHHSDPG